MTGSRALSDKNPGLPLESEHALTKIEFTTSKLTNGTYQ